MSKRRPLCPQCVSNKVVPILYGMPTHEAWEESKNGKFIIGGCCVSDKSPLWHCPVCGYEFGNVVPSIDDLLQPTPNGIKPLKLEFFIGGFSGPNHSLKLENGTLKYKLFQAHPNYPEKELEIVPTTRKWINFRRKLDALNVWEWKRRYDNPDVCDGTQWSFEADYGIKRIKSYGSNSYPGCEGIMVIEVIKTEENNDFDALLHALKLLLGGVKIT